MIENIVDPDQMAKPSDLDLQFFQNRTYPGSAEQGLIKHSSDYFSWTHVEMRKAILLDRLSEPFSSIKHFVYVK